MATQRGSSDSRRLMVWGRHDVYFDLAEMLSWMRALPRMEAHVLDAGHLLLETHAAEAVALMCRFMSEPRRTGGRRVPPEAAEVGQPPAQSTMSATSSIGRYTGSPAAIASCPGRVLDRGSAFT